MWRLAFLLLAAPAQADSVVAARMIRAQAVISPQDVTLVPDLLADALADPAEAVGMEARVAIFPGRAVRLADLSRPALVDRNQKVVLLFSAGALTIAAEGKALARGGAGDVIRVLNLSSRSTVTGRIGSDGSVVVGP